MEAERTTPSSLHSQILILSHKLKMLQEEEMPIAPVPSQDLIPTIKQIFQLNGQDMETTILPVFLSWLEGKSIPQEQLQTQLSELVGGTAKFWKKLLSKHAELKEGDDSNKVWEVRKKYVQLTKEHLDVERVCWVREVRTKRRKVVEMFAKQIADITQNTMKQDELNEQHLKLLKAEIDFRKMLKSEGVKAVKTKKKEQTAVVNENKEPNQGELKKQQVGENQIKNQEDPNHTPTKKANETEAGSTQNKESGSQDNELKQPENENEEQVKIQNSATKEKKPKKIKQPKEPKEPKQPKQSKPSKEPKEPKPVKQVPVPAVNPIFSRFFKPKIVEPKVQEPVFQSKLLVEDEVKKEIEEEPQYYSILNLLTEPSTELEVDKQFGTKKQKRERAPVHLHIVDNIFYIEGGVVQEHFVDPLCPNEEYEKVNYEKSEDEYSEYREQFAGDEINDDEARSEDEDESQARTIVPDSYVSFEDAASESADEPQQNQSYGFGEKSVYNYRKCAEPLQGTGIIMLAGKGPLPTRPPVPELITDDDKLFLIQVLHGSFENNVKLVDRIFERLPLLAKTAIRDKIEEYSTKEAGRRLIKPYLVEDMRALIESNGVNLEEIVKLREKECEQEREQRRLANREKREDLKRQKELERQTQLPFGKQEFPGMVEMEEEESNNKQKQERMIEVGEPENNL